jgi:anti-sigma B factor antagonist
MAIDQGPQFTVQRKTFGTTEEIVVQGELDIASAPDLRATVATAICSGPERIVIDLRHVTFIDSTGISVLLRLRSRAIAGQIDMIVVRPTGDADRIFEICGIEGVFPALDGNPGLDGHRPGGIADRER